MEGVVLIKQRVIASIIFACGGMADIFIFFMCLEEILDKSVFRLYYNIVKTNNQERASLCERAFKFCVRCL